jgi:aryl-alcohol dehydrogenase-like predicted oxidoreductase
MRFRRLGRIGLDVSECTFGTSALRHCALAEGLAAIAAARDCGINAFEIDAGDSDAIGLLGKALAGGDAHVFARATSLVPFPLPSPHVPAHRAYPGRHLRVEAEALLARLGVERLALLQLHAWCPEWLHEGDWLESLEQLRDEGKIAGFGVSLFDHDAEAGLEAAASGRIDSVQVMLNVFDPAAAASLLPLLPLCRTHDVAVIARSPLYYGAFAGLRDYPHDDWRSGYFFDAHRRETDERVARLAREAAPLLDTALRFGLSHPAVSTVAVGMRSRAQVEANVQALAHGPLDADMLALLARHAWLT